LPTIIKSKDDITIVYYYLNKLFNCSFDNGEFSQFIFNPELIQLLFGNAKQFYIQKCKIYIDDDIGKIFGFILNNLVGEKLKISFFQDDDIIEKYGKTLFKILLNGDKFQKIKLVFDNDTKKSNNYKNVLYEQIIEVIC